MNIFQRWKQTALHNKALVLSGAIVAVGTLVSTGTAVFQLCMVRKYNRDTSQQIEKLITAANIQGDAAKGFAGSAGKINDGIDLAVEKLNLQADAANRLARDTETANKNVLEADRPWMGAFISVANFEVGKTATFSITFANSGKRPAKVDLTALRERSYAQFPANPDSEYIFDTVPSTSVVVPGQAALVQSTSLAPLSLGEMDAMVSGRLTYFVFAKIEYRDMKTNQAFWTHVCFRYMPQMKSATDNGFRNCAQYNDAK